MTTRTVTARWIKPDGSPAPYAITRFELDPSTYSTDDMVLGSLFVPDGSAPDSAEITAIADEFGYMSVDLWANADALEPNYYTVTWPSARQDRIVVPPGDTPISLRELLGQELPGWRDPSTAAIDLAIEGIYEALANTSDILLGDAMVGSRYEPGGEGRTVHDRLADVMSIFDFIPAAEHEAIRAGIAEGAPPSSYDCVADIQRAIDTAAADGRTVAFPPGLYCLASQTLDPISTRANHSLLFTGLHDFQIVFQEGARLSVAGDAYHRPLIFRNCYDFTIDGIQIYETRETEGNGICFENCRDYTVRNCHAENFRRYGFVSSEDTSKFLRQSTTISFVGATQSINGGTMTPARPPGQPPGELAGPLPGQRLYIASSEFNNGFCSVKAVDPAGYWIEVEQTEPDDRVLVDESAGPTADVVTSSWFTLTPYNLAVDSSNDPNTYLYEFHDGDYFTLSGSQVANNHDFQINDVSPEGRSMTLYQEGIAESPNGSYPITLTRLSRPLVQVWDAQTHGDVTFDRCSATNCGIYGFEIFPKALSGSLRLLHLKATRCGLLNAAGTGIKGGTNFSAVHMVSPTITKCHYGINLGNFRATVVENPHITNGYAVGIAITTSSHIKAPLKEYGSLVIRGGYIGFTNDPDDPDGDLFTVVKPPDTTVSMAPNKPAISLNGLVEDVGLLEVTGLTIYKWSANETGYGYGGIQFNKSTVPSTNVRIHHNKIVDSGGFLTLVLEGFTATVTPGSNELTALVNYTNLANPTAGWLKGMQVVGAGIPTNARVGEVIKGATPKLTMVDVVTGAPVLATGPGVATLVPIRSGIPRAMQVTDNEFVTSNPADTVSRVDVWTNGGQVSRNTIKGFQVYSMRLICRDGEHIWAMNNRIESPYNSTANRGPILLGGSAFDIDPGAPVVPVGPIDALGIYHIYNTVLVLTNPLQADNLIAAVAVGSLYTGGNIFPDTCKLVTPSTVQPVQEPVYQGKYRTFYGSAAPTAAVPYIQGDRMINTAPSAARAISHWVCVVGGSPGTWVAVGHGRGSTAQRPAPLLGDHEYGYYDTTIAREIRMNGGTLSYVVPYEPRMLFRARNTSLVSNTTTETTIQPTGVIGSLSLPANYFALGTTVRLEAWGNVKTAAAQTLRIRVMYGAQQLVDSGALAMPTLAAYVGWHIRSLMTCRVASATGQVGAGLRFSFAPAVGTIGAMQVADFPVTPAVIDTTQGGLLAIMVTWSTATTNNGFVTNLMTAEDVIV